MASEGYDNPDLSSIAYLSNVAAPLRLAQIGGRVMRPTEHESKLGRNLPGTVWLPAIPKLTAAWRDVLLNELHTISVDELTCARCGLSKPCACELDPRTAVCPIVRTAEAVRVRDRRTRPPPGPTVVAPLQRHRPHRACTQRGGGHRRRLPSDH